MHAPGSYCTERQRRRKKTKVKFSPGTRTFSIITLHSVLAWILLIFLSLLSYCFNNAIGNSERWWFAKRVEVWATTARTKTMRLLKSQNLSTLSLLLSGSRLSFAIQQQQLSVCSHSITTVMLRWRWINGRKWMLMPFFRMFFTKISSNRRARVSEGKQRNKCEIGSHKTRNRWLQSNSSPSVCSNATYTVSSTRKLETRTSVSTGTMLVCSKLI